jgi:pimeloyl-ACP methyl ester carboxylesterase
MVALNDAGVRTVAYDRRGHGRSSDPGVVDYDLLADDLHEVVAALDLRDVTIVAHSASSGEAIRYLSRHGSGRVARMIIVGGTGPRMLAAANNPNGLPAEMLETVLSQLASDLEGWIDANAEPFAPGATRRTIDWLGAMLLETSRRILVDFQREAAETDLTAEAKAVTVPTTIIHGDRDASAPIDLTARRYAEIIQGAELIVYEGTAHGVMITAGERLASDILARMPS